MSVLSAAVSGVSGLVSVVTPSPTPTPTGVAATSLGSPGITGFIVTFLVALALIGLFLSLTRHLRIVDRRSRQRDEAEAAAAAAAAGVVLPRPDANDAAGGV
jgi:hypothetical protein